jgi:hypothetical protein
MDQDPQTITLTKSRKTDHQTGESARETGNAMLQRAG